MTLSSQDITGIVFKQTVGPDIGELALDGLMLSVLMQTDGKKSLREIAGRLNLSVSDLRPVVSRLLESRLIEPAQAPEQTADPEFINTLVAQLSIAIGPMGRIIFQDGLEVLGYSAATLPARQAAELVNLLSREIPREEKRVRFKQAMLHQIRERGYF